jgi:Circadian oscillating protein COP23
MLFNLVIDRGVNMKNLSITPISQRQLLAMGVSTLALIGSISFAPSSQALTATTSFVCGKSEGKPATIARTKKGDFPIILWSSEAMSESGFTPQVRCQQVSARFQSMYRSGRLKALTTGTLNNQPVICATNKGSTSCNAQNFLYTLKPNADPQQVIKRLNAIRNRASSRSVEESAATNPTSNNSIDLDWLNEDN